MSDLKQIFPHFSAYPADHKLAQKDEIADVAQWREICEGLFDHKGVKTVLTGAAEQWNGRSHDQDKEVLALYPVFLRSLRGKAARSAKKATHKDLRAVYKAALNAGQAKTTGRRSTVIQGWLGDEYEAGSDDEVETFCDQKEAILDDQLGRKVTVEELLKVSTLTNLPPTFDSVSVGLMAEDSTDIRRVTKKLSEHEIQLKKREDEEDTAVVKAAKAQANSGPTQFDFDKAVQRATDKAIAKVQQAQGFGNGSWNNNWNNAKKVHKSNDWCPYCKQWGHVVSKCFKKQRAEQNKGKGGKGKGGKGKGKGKF